MTERIVASQELKDEFGDNLLWIFIDHPLEEAIGYFEECENGDVFPTGYYSDAGYPEYEYEESTVETRTHELNYYEVLNIITE